MSGEKITIRVSKGKMRIEAEGFKGKTCLDELAKIEKGLSDGGVDLKNKEQKLKSEASVTESVGEGQVARR